MSDVLVNAIRPTLAAVGLSELFAGIVIIPIIGNISENVVGVQLALRNDMNFSIVVSMGASLQVALFVAPLLVFASLILGHPMNLIFTPLELVTVGFGTLIMALIANDGEVQLALKARSSSPSMQSSRPPSISSLNSVVCRGRLVGGQAAVSGYNSAAKSAEAGGSSMDPRGMRAEDFQALWQRLLRVARLDATAFLEVRNDPAATVPALIVVAVAAILSGIGGWLLYLNRVVSVVDQLVPRNLPAGLQSAIPRPSGTPFFFHSVIIGSIAEFALWLLWVAITAGMLQQVWHRQVEFLSLVRTMGLAFFPVALSLLVFIEPLASAIGLIALAAAVFLSGVAVEAATEAEPAQVLVSNLVGFAVFAIVLGLLGHNGELNAPYAPGLFAFSI